MAVEIQEPNDLPPNAITDDNADRYEVLVYEKSPDAAGIKRLGIAGWKDYLGFNSHKVNNVASYVGMPNDYDWESNSDVPYTGTTVTNQIDTLATKLGISQEPGTFNPLYPRFQTVESDVETPTTGLKDRMDAVETDIQSIEEEIGSGGGGSSGSLTARISALEGTVGDSDSGLVKEVNTLDTQVQDANIGLLKRTTDIETTLNGSTPGTGLISDVNALQTTVGDSDSGLVKEVADNAADISNINGILGDGTTDGLRKTVNDLNTTVNDPNDGLVKRVSDIESNVFKFCGNITGVDDPDNTTSVIIDGTSTPIADLNNGEVYNINPSGSAQSIKMTIYGHPAVTYSKGQNVVWVEKDPATDSYFDELAANIDVEEVNKIAARYGSQQIATNTSYDISNLLTSDGIYQLTLCPKTGAVRVPSIIIITWVGGSPAASSDTDIIKITPDNFSNYWEFDSGSGSLLVKSSTGAKVITFTKIGEL